MILTFYWFISTACQILHFSPRNAPQSDNNIQLSPEGRARNNFRIVSGHDDRSNSFLLGLVSFLAGQMYMMNYSFRAHKPKIYFPRVVAKSYRKWANPDVCFDACIVNNGSSCMSPGFHVKVPQYTATR